MEDHIELICQGSTAISCGTITASLPLLSEHFRLFSPSSTTMKKMRVVWELPCAIEIVRDVLSSIVQETTAQEIHLRLLDYLQPKEPSELAKRLRCDRADTALMKKIGSMLDSVSNPLHLFILDEDIARYVLLHREHPPPLPGPKLLL